MGRPVDFLTLDSPAKVNLTLSVGSANADGMHPIASWMVALTFGDRLTLHRLPEGMHTSCFSMAYAVDAPRRQAIDWPLEKDLAWRAHTLMIEKLGRNLPIKGTLEKRIPTGAGLGGGSSNAAAMLVGLNRLFDLRLSAETLCQWSSQLGSDVAYLTAALMGQPQAIVTGLGETITPLPAHRLLDVVLIFPPVGCETRQVYQQFDLHLAGASKPADATRVTTLATTGRVDPSSLNHDLFNDLASPACNVQPRIHNAMQTSQSLLGQPVHVTGSGSTLFTLARDEAHAHELAIQISQGLGLPCLATQTLQA